MNMLTTFSDEALRTGDAGAVEAALATTYSLEVTEQALDAPHDPVSHIAAGTRVYLPFLSGSRFIDNFDACRRLLALGLTPVPHLAARGLTGMDELAGDLPRYAEAGVDTVLLIAGDLSEPAGPFINTLEVLDTGLLHANGICNIGVAGHPEGHPHADEDELFSALAAKQDYAHATGADMWITTQFLFEAGPLAAWDQRLRAAGISLPVRAGIPGPARLSTLVSFALRCGVGASARMLTRRPSAMKLLGRWTPDPLTGEIAAHIAANPETLIEGLHIYTFGGVDAALEWVGNRRPTTADTAKREAEY